jgi:putative CocE/NonD family hydrolase
MNHFDSKLRKKQGTLAFLIFTNFMILYIKTTTMKIHPKRRLLTAVLLFILMFSIHAGAQSVTGKWYGLVNLFDIKLRLELTIDSSASGYSLTFDSPDENSYGNVVTTFTYAYPGISFSHKDLRLNFSGTVDAAYRHITGIFSQYNATTDVTFGRDVIPPAESSLLSIQEKYHKREVDITMRDGVRLFTSIYTPDDTIYSHPIMMIRTPYNSEPGGSDRFSFYMSVYYRYIRENYIMVFQDVRGCYMSEGHFVDVRPYIPDKKSDKDIDESSDTYDAVDWLVTHVPHNNGRVGVMGISYPGFYATMAILSGHPAIRAVSPQAPVTNWFLGDDWHHNGAFCVLDCFPFEYGFGRPRPMPTRREPSWFQWPVQDNYQFFMDLETVHNITRKYMDDTIPFWNDVMHHPNYDTFWKARDPRPYLKDVKPAVMTVGGWFDAEDLWGTLHTYAAIETQNTPSLSNHLVVGPWFHHQWGYGRAENVGNIYWGQDANKAYQEMEVHFFNHYLKDGDSSTFPEAFIFVTGVNEWRSFDTWPPEGIKELELYLHEDGILSFSSPVLPESYDEYVSDPAKPVPYDSKVQADRGVEFMTGDQRFAARRPDVMVYRTGVLKENVTLTGQVTVDLYVTTTGTDADFVVKLIDVFPDNVEAPTGEQVDVPLGGYQMLVRGEVFRGRYRNSFENPVPFTPGQITELKFDMNDIAYCFKKSHRIMVQVQSSWFPLVDRNPQTFVNIYTCMERDFKKATQKIYHDTRHPSHLTVRMLKE